MVSGSRCAWGDCGTEPPRGHLMCGKHRARLSNRLRDSVPATASALPESVLAFIRQAVADEEAAAQREADLRRRQEVLF